MPKRPRIFLLAVIASFVFIGPIIWFGLDANLHLKNAGAATSASVRSEAVAPEPFQMAHAASETTTRMLRPDQAKHHAFWTSVLKKKKRACDVVVRAIYQGGTDSGIDSWSVSCQNGHTYSISINPNAQDSVCTQNTFAGARNSAW